MNTKNMKLVVASMAIVLSLAMGCSKQVSIASGESTSKSEAAADGPDIKAIDKHGDEIMASSSKAEAREWMKQPKHVFFKADPKQVAQFVEDFYQAGAVQVFIADIEDEGGNQFGESLLVVLPKDSNARAKLFQVEASAETVFQDDPVSDKGQKYLYNGLD